METKKVNWKKLLLAAGVVLVVLLLALSIGSVVLYDSNFNEHLETPVWLAFEPEDFEGLRMERCYFPSNDQQMLVGYRYSKTEQDIKGLVVISHGLGAGQNQYMNVADYFTSNGYLVFAYDCTGNDASEGDDVGGLPQGVIDLDYALRYVKSVPEYKNLDIVLFGHSWGAYSAGCVLNYHPDVKAVVMVSGMNRSSDMLEYQGKDMIGNIMTLALPFVNAYERLKFGTYASATAMDGFDSSEAGVMVIHSQDDEVVPPEYGYDVFYEVYANDQRFRFVPFENRGHNRILNSLEADVSRELMNEAYRAYVEAKGAEHTAEIKVEFMNQYPNRMDSEELDQELFAKILDFCDTYTVG